MNPAIDRLRRAFGRGVYPHQFAWLIDNAFRRIIITPERLADRVSAAKEAVILELGPGSGYFSLELARRIPAGRLILVDIQPEMLQKAKRKLTAQQFSNASFAVCDGGLPLPMRDGVADVVLLVSVLGEVGDRSACLKSAFRVLRAGGRLVVHESIPDPDLIRFSELREMTKVVGFRFDRRWGLPWNYTAAFHKPA